MTGAARPTAAQKGRSFDLDAAMKAKMENAFGDLSAVKLYRSQAVADAGAEAIAQGNEIAFAPGMADFSTKAGQERLGHELSHVMSQRSGQVRGSGFLNNAALEARADREGAMAAAGQQVCAGPVTHTLSDASPSPMTAGVMQAKRGGGKNRKKRQQRQRPNVATMTPAIDLKGPDLSSLTVPAPPLSPKIKPNPKHIKKKPSKPKLTGIDEPTIDAHPAIDLKGPDLSSLTVPAHPLSPKIKPNPKHTKKKPSKPKLTGIDDDVNGLDLTQSDHGISDNIISDNVISNGDTGSNDILSNEITNLNFPHPNSPQTQGVQGF